MPIYSGDINITGSIIPSADDTYDAGTPEAAFQDIYVSSGSLWIGDTHKMSIDTDGKLKFRKRKTTVVPAIILSAGGSAAAARSFSGKSTLAKMKLKHWKAYARSLGGGLANAKIKDIFRIDKAIDYQEASEIAQEDIKSFFDTLKGSGNLQGISSADSPTFTALTTTGKITAQEFHTSFVSSSIIFQSGSTIFGNSNDDVHTFLGSTISGSSISTGSFGAGYFAHRVGIGTDVFSESGARFEVYGGDITVVEDATIGGGADVRCVDKNGNKLLFFCQDAKGYLKTSESAMELILGAGSWGTGLTLNSSNNATFAGTVAATNLSGTNTGDTSITDSTSTTSSSTRGSATGVKAAYDRGSTGVTNAASAQTTANAALPKAGGAMTGAITTNSTFDGVDIATRDGILTSTTTTAGAALPKAGGAMTGAITTNSTFDGVDIATRDGILTSTTTTAGAALPKAGGAMTGAITTNSTFDGVDIATRDGILTSTTTTAGAALPKAGGTMTGQLDIHNDYSLLFQSHGSQATSRSWKFYNDVSALGDFQLRMSTSNNNTIPTSNATIHTTWNKLGNMGIGTVSPSARLHVYGSVSENQPLFKVSGTSGSLFEISDSREGILYGVTDRSGNPVFTTTADGKVGIGTTSPGKLLHVSGGDIELDNTYSLIIKNAAGGETPVIGVNSGDDVIIGNQDLDQIIFVTDNANPAMTLTRPGNVGIGTAEPAAKFHVQGTISGSGDMYLGPKTTGTAAGGWTVNDNGTDIAAGQGLVINQQSNNLDAIELHHPGGSNNTYSGIRFVGANWQYARIIGGAETYSPDAGFMAFQTAAGGGGGNNLGNALYLAADKTATLGGNLKMLGGSTGRLYANDRRLLEGSADGALVQYGEDFTYNYFNSNVGIGTTVPAVGLHLSGESFRWADNEGGSFTYSYVDGSGFYIEAIGQDAARSRMRFQTRNTNSGAYTSITIDADPHEIRHQINGTATFTVAASLGALTGNLTATGDITSNYSDIRLKENIRPIEDALTKLDTLSGIQFDYKEADESIGYEPFRKSDVGLIAQEVEKVLPDAVSIAPFDKDSDGNSKSGEDYLTIRYERLVPLLVQAVKELSSEVKELKEKINE